MRADNHQKAPRNYFLGWTAFVHPIWHNESVKNESKPRASAKPIRLMVMADYCYGLFLPDGATAPESLGLPAELCARFEDWLKLYREPDRVSADYDRAGYNAQGRRLAGEIADALKDTHQIVYRYLLPLEHPDDEWEWDAEQISDKPVHKFDLSAGCSCTVSKVGGGLQPRLEELPIPPEFLAKIEAWMKKYDATCWEPSYSHRKEHDAEGRAIAEGLQQAVADKNIQVVFRQWMEFDPKQWRSYWRDENLFTWSRKQFWLSEDLPDELATKVLRIYPDFGGAYLWDLDGCCLCVDFVGGTEEFDDRFTKWAILWDHCTSTKTPVTDVATLAAEHFDEKGLALAAELKRVVGDRARIIYRFTLKTVDAEILADGSITELPRNTDYRQWALDQRT